jgi:hypothetical protein
MNYNNSLSLWNFNEYFLKCRVRTSAQCHEDTKYPGPGVYVVLRVVFKPDGSLPREPGVVKDGPYELLAERHVRHLAGRAQTLQDARKPMHTDPSTI